MPTEEVGTFGDQIKHVCTAVRILLANAEGKRVPLKEASLEKLKTKEEILAELRRMVDLGTAAIRRVSGKIDGDVVESQFFGKTTRRRRRHQASSLLTSNSSTRIVRASQAITAQRS